MIQWSDEFEYTASDEKTYYVYVNLEDNEVVDFSIKDDFGEDASDSAMFDEIKEEIYNREFEFEIETQTFDFYDQQLDHFNDKFSLKDI